LGVDYLSLNVFTIPLEIRRAYTLKVVPVSVKAVANVKIKAATTRSRRARRLRAAENPHRYA
jgi:hypothetical protein